MEGWHMTELDKLALVALERDFFTPKEIARVLGTSDQTIRLQARAGMLKFPAVCMGSRTRIPARPFLDYMGWRE